MYGDFYSIAFGKNFLAVVPVMSVVRNEVGGLVSEGPEVFVEIVGGLEENGGSAA